ncbi:MAG: redox-sensing transcriptional repressor Rex [Clostridia bacterium]|nr:redox-sensing transcriptional repressor Rex [Clostridia bacterium]
MINEIPEISLKRLPVYLNYLRNLDKEKNKYISSGAIALALGMGEVLVRKDLAYTEAVGRPKIGYLTEELITALESFLHCNEVRNAVIVGVGGIGRAILGYGGFKNYGIEMVAAFDSDEKKIGTTVAGKPVLSTTEFKSGLKQYNADMAVLTVPASAAQAVANELYEAGIKAILNFAPVQLTYPKHVIVRNIDVAARLAVLSTLIK